VHFLKLFLPARTYYIAV